MAGMAKGGALALAAQPTGRKAMAEPQAIFALVLTGGRVCDPANVLDKVCDIAVAGDRIAAVGDGLAPQARRTIDLAGKIVTPGWIDLHTHVFEWMTTFGLPP